MASNQSASCGGHAKPRLCLSLKERRSRSKNTSVSLFKASSQSTSLSDVALSDRENNSMRENDRASSPNGGLKDTKKASKPKEVEKRAGQRRAIKSHKCYSSRAHEVIIVIDADEVVSIDESSGSDDGNELASRAPPKKKARKFSRCSKRDKHLCDVCKLPDCGKCSNCQ